MIKKRAVVMATVLSAALGCTAISPHTPERGPVAQPAVTTSAVALKVNMPDEMTPMTLNAALAKNTVAPGETVAVMVGVRLLPGWHTYAVVPPEEPYIQTRYTLDLGPGVTSSGDWISPPPVADATNPRLKIYESTAEPLVFMHPLKVASTASGDVRVQVRVLFQTCDMSRCLPPAEQTFDLTLKITPAK